jgi:hypothetical protein
MRYTFSRLHPDEKLVFYTEKGRSWYDILLRLFLSLATIVGGLLISAWLWVLFGLYRMPIPDAEMDLLRYHLLNLLFTLLPLMALYIAVRDFIFHFKVELALTDQRVMGQIPGFFRLRHIKIPLDDIIHLSDHFNRLVLETKKEKTYVVWGLKKRQTFIMEFHRLQQPPTSFYMYINRLKTLQELMDLGVITPEEFEAQKLEILSPLGNDKSN